MSASEQISSFVAGFYTAFIKPIFDILRSTSVLGFSLFYWVFGFTVLALAVRFFQRFFGSGDDKK